MSESKATIEIAPGGPFLVKGLQLLFDSDGNPIPMDKDVIALCRCGASKNKPFCDGTHSDIGFSGDKERTETYPVREYEGEELTVVDDIGICCHAGECVKGAPDVFFHWDGDERKSKPDAADRQKIIDVIRKCPSGSLAYKLSGDLHDEYFSEEEIFVAKDGPLQVRGGIAFDHSGEAPCAQDHYTLCRCGASKNKPYCDGSHKDAGFKG